MSTGETESRFEIIEALVTECPCDGRSERLERWMTISRDSLELVQQTGGAREKRSAAKIAEAQALVQSLVMEGNS
ncbi:MAG: hypothetical protein ACI841_000726 [Planctomycetota bacterium]|jgi:hypothetical protein